MEKIKFGVIGAGNMGKNHIRIANELPQFELAGFYDPSPQGAELSKQYGIPCFSGVAELLEQVDAVTVAAPSHLHREIGLQVAAAKKHALIEKPLALNTADAVAVQKAFAAAGTKLMVGHVERLNPVVVELANILQTMQVIAVEIHRCSPWDGRIIDADVIQDLMIHDIDILVNLIAPHKIASCSALGRNVYSNGQVDYAQVFFQFENGPVASIVSSRITEDKIRDIVVHAKNALIRTNLLTRTLSITRHATYSFDGLSSPQYRQDSITEQVFVAPVEPLRQELHSFANCILQDTTPEVTGEEAIRAIETIEMIARQVY